MKSGNVNMTSTTKYETYLQLAANEKLSYANELHEMNLIMGEHLSSSLMWTINYCKKNNIPLPDIDKIQNIINDSKKIEDSHPQINRKFTGEGISRRLYRT